MKHAMCRRFKALKDLPMSPEYVGDGRLGDWENCFFSKGEILVEVAPGWGKVRPNDAPPGFVGLPLEVLQRKDDLLEEIESVPFEGSENFEFLKRDLFFGIEKPKQLIEEGLRYFEGTQLEGALRVVQRGLKCIEGDHELKPCQMHMKSVMACPHCGYYEEA